jgi:hypothetical protein
MDSKFYHVISPRGPSYIGMVKKGDGIIVHVNGHDFVFESRKDFNFHSSFREWMLDQPKRFGQLLTTKKALEFCNNLVEIGILKEE